MGATNQGSSATDATEASAGWYWQFNRKRGYKHDGTAVTPVWTITTIIETSDWIASEDPCTIELGSGWRIPTETEWTNANVNGVSGGWDDYNETYADVLKLHAAGYLFNNPCLLLDRGIAGVYCSSTEESNGGGWALFINSSISGMGSNNKAYGFSIRCIKD